MIDAEINDTFDELDAALANKKRARDIALQGQDTTAQDLDDKVQSQ